MDSEDEQLSEFMDNLCPRVPMLKIYRIEEDGKQTFLGALAMGLFCLDEVRSRFGGGKFLIRSVRSNGTYGPSRVVQIAPRR